MLGTNFASNFSFFSRYYSSVDFDINIVIQKVSFLMAYSGRKIKLLCSMLEIVFENYLFRSSVTSLR